MILASGVNVIPEFASTIALDQARGIEGGSVGLPPFTGEYTACLLANKLPD